MKSYINTGRDFTWSRLTALPGLRLQIEVQDESGRVVSHVLSISETMCLTTALLEGRERTLSLAPMGCHTSTAVRDVGLQEI